METAFSTSVRMFTRFHSSFRSQLRVVRQTFPWPGVGLSVAAWRLEHVAVFMLRSRVHTCEVVNLAAEPTEHREQHSRYIVGRKNHAVAVCVHQSVLPAASMLCFTVCRAATKKLTSENSANNFSCQTSSGVNSIATFRAFIFCV